MTAFAASLGWIPGSYAEVIGLRHDEGMRIFKMLERNEKDGRRCIARSPKPRSPSATCWPFGIVRLSIWT